MHSHTYDFTRADVGRLLGGLVLPLIGFAVIMRLGATTGTLPAPQPNFDVDQTILIHQAQASQSPSGADLLLLGDSSCLMNVSGKYLEDLAGTGHRVLNLGSLSYLGLNGFATLLARYADANPGRLRTVVVLAHPEMLRGIAPVPQYLLLLSDYYAGADSGDASTVQGQMSGFLGLDIFRDRLWSRVPQPLPKAYGQYYGFNADLDAFMSQHRGSVVDPYRYARQPGQGNAEYRLASSWQGGCQALKAAVPPTAKLVIGITPVPDSFAPPKYAARWQAMLEQWGQWIQADARLADLPPTLPEADFASTTHLNETGARRYTQILAHCLEPVLAPAQK